MSLFMRDFLLVLSCEHASRDIPTQYQPLFQGCEKILDSHRGWDIGAYTAFQYLSQRLPCEAIAANHSRLLIDLNRSLSNHSVLSEFTQNLSKPEKEAIIEKIYRPYRDKLTGTLKKARHILHLSIHSFTPSLNGKKRANDIGLLYDPSRRYEALFCKAWKKALAAQDPGLIVRMNTPYRGTSDGLTKALRAITSPAQYCGIELELNQKHFFNDGREKGAMIKCIESSLKEVIKTFVLWNA